MQHIDEGTIHAWLDGALDTTESADVETHVAQCAQCSAAVAEARGLVAGASRILNALDDVPANVLPKRAVAPVTARVARRQWRAAPWVTGIAAALMLAIGLTQMEKDGEGKQSLVSTETAPALAPAPFVDTSAPPVVAPAPAAPTTPSASARQMRESQSSANRAVPAPRADLAAADEVAGPVDLRRAEKSALSGEASRLAAASDLAQGAASRVSAGAGAAGQIAPPSLQDAQAQRAQNAQQMKVEAAASPSVLPAPPAAPSAVLRESATFDVGRLAGCYRVPQIKDQKLDQVMPKAVAAVAGRAASSARARAAEQPAAAASFAAPAPPDIIRLDTTRHPLGFVVREARSDSSIGTWRGIPGDSARADLLAAGLFTFVLKDRIACPEPK